MKLFLCSLALFFATVITVPATADPSSLVGQYSGEIFSNGSKQGTTQFALSASRKIVGAYEFGSKNEREKGTLSRCKLRDNLLTCRWSDPYGVGPLTVRFSADFCNFEGLWYARGDRNDSSRHYPWSGKRKNCASLSS